MAIYYTLYCGRCGGKLYNDDKCKRYVHCGVAPEKETHRPERIKSTIEKES